MSSPSRSRERADLAEHANLETSHLSKQLSQDFSVNLPDHTNDVAANGSGDGIMANSDSSSPPAMTEHSSTNQSHASRTLDDAARPEQFESIGTFEVQQPASDHLARRAADMRSDELPSSYPSRNELPASPPPPAPPRKDSFHVRNGQNSVPTKPPLQDEGRNEVPDGSHGAAEAAGQEIQSIMDQFGNGVSSPGEQEIMSPRLEKQQPILVLPPRSSSLEPRERYTSQPLSPSGTESLKAKPQGSFTAQGESEGKDRANDTESLKSAKAGSIFQPPPPSPDIEPALPFDFHRFLEQLRHRTADPVARFLRSFLNEFAKKQWMVHEQVKIISDFLEFISQKMAQCEVWRSVSDAEFDNAREGMEKLVMNRLYSQTFSPAIAPASGSSPRKTARGGKGQMDAGGSHGVGRRGQHQEDVERDDVIAQKIKIYGWVEEEHLDIKPVGEKGKRFMTLAQQELLKINSYRAPRDKVICVLNCCKVLFGFLKNAKADQSADAFVPLLIYTVLRARPDNLVSNVQYIWRFRSQEKLGGEAGYYMSSLTGVVTFIEGLDRTNLTISDQDFEKHVEQAVSAIAEKNSAQEYEEKSHASFDIGPIQQSGEKSNANRLGDSRKLPVDSDTGRSRRPANNRFASRDNRHEEDEEEDDADPMAGLLRTIQKPLNSIGRMFTDEGIGGQPAQSADSRSAAALIAGSSARARSVSPRNVGSDRFGAQRAPSTAGVRGQRSLTPVQQGEVAAAKQASVEVAQVEQVKAKEHAAVVETLQSMFPNLEKDVIEDVVRAQEGNVGRAVDGCLALGG